MSTIDEEKLISDNIAFFWSAYASLNMGIILTKQKLEECTSINMSKEIEQFILWLLS
jgi:hypothetical protein